MPAFGPHHNSRPELGKTFGWAIIAIIVVVATIASLLGDEIGRKVDSVISRDDNSPPQQDIGALLQQAASAVNKKAPVEVDALTRLDSATAGPGRAFSYSYTVLDRQKALLDSSRVRAAMEPTLRRGFCTHDSMRFMRDNGVTVTYEYHDELGGLIAAIAVSSDDCRALSRN